MNQEVVDVESGEASDSRPETTAKRDDRNLGELIQELRVAGLGMKERLVRFANVVAILGLAAVGGSVLAAVLLVTWYVAGALAGA